MDGCSLNGHDVQSSSVAIWYNYCITVLSSYITIHRQVSYIQSESAPYTYYYTDNVCCTGYGGNSCSGLWVNWLYS